MTSQPSPRRQSCDLHELLASPLPDSSFTIRRGRAARAHKPLRGNGVILRSLARRATAVTRFLLRSATVTRAVLYHALTAAALCLRIHRTALRISTPMERPHRWIMGLRVGDFSDAMSGMPAMRTHPSTQTTRKPADPSDFGAELQLHPVPSNASSTTHSAMSKTRHQLKKPSVSRSRNLKPDPDYVSWSARVKQGTLRICPIGEEGEPPRAFSLTLNWLPIRRLPDLAALIRYAQNEHGVVKRQSPLAA